MAKISLRAYNREIESLIEQGSYDQAIDHCRYILKSYPKHIESYRLLGKAYLESHRYGEAADIFERVLSSLPGDFVSHVGMSIIREDEGDLDTAIWHMERAYESQPANQAIQAELSRLYGRRDGFEPPKIRLTRGALARMYYKGDLYPQAIAETRAALAEDPNRFDLQALLAETYFQSGQKVEAAEAASALLKKLPFSLAANRILADVLGDSERAEESKTYRQRVQALDPYESQRSSTFTNASQVNDEAIMLEMLDWHPGELHSLPSSQPDWAASLGVDMEEFSASGDEETPEWLKQVEAFKDQAEPAGEEPVLDDSIIAEAGSEQEDSAVEGSGEELIPDWMSAAGWEPGSPEGTQEEPAWEEAEPDEATPSDLPDWVQAMAPSEDDETEKLPSTEDIADLSWLDEAPSAPADTLATWLEENASEPAAHPEPVEADEEEIPEWLSGLSAEAPMAEATSTEELPDWLTGEVEEETTLQDLAPEAGETPSEAESAALPEIESEPEAMPEPEAPQPVADAEELPEWLSELEEPLETMAPESEVPAAVEPSPVEESVTPPATEIAETEVEGVELDDDEAFAWLESLAARQGAEEAFLLDPTQRREEPPDWVQEAGVDEETALAMEETPAEAGEEPLTELPGDEIPAWLQEFGAEVEAEAAEVEFSAEEPEIGESQTVASVEAEEQLEGLPEETSLPFGDEELEVEDAEAFAPSVEDAGPEGWEPTTGDRQLEEPEAEQEEWLEIEEPPVITGDTQPTTPLREPDTSGLPDWLQGLDEAEPAELTADTELASEAAEGVAVPAWLQELAEEVEAPEVDEEQEAAVAYLDESTAEAGDLPDWLHSLAPEEDETGEMIGDQEVAAQEPAAFETSPAEGMELTEPFAEQEVESTADETTAELEGIGLEDEEAFAWLESLAARQGADEALLLEPEERRAEPPDWVQEASKEPLPEEGPGEVDELVMEIPETLAAEEEIVSAEEQSVSEPVEEPEPVSEVMATPEADEIAEEISAEAAEVSEAEAVESVPELPSWLEGIEEETTPALASEWEALEAEAPVAAAEEQEIAAPQRLDVNTAGLGQLERLPGVGYTRAAALLAFREAHGPIQELNDLKQVEGFDEALVTVLAEHLTTGQPEPGPAVAMISDDSFEVTLVQARNALAQGDQAAALEAYDRLIEYEQFLPEVISDLHEALYRFPVDIDIWQALGDAYARSDQYQEALDAYTKAEELLK